MPDKDDYDISKDLDKLDDYEIEEIEEDSSDNDDESDELIVDDPPANFLGNALVPA